MPATNSHFPERSEVKWPPTYEILIKSLPHLVGWKTEKECSTNVAGKTKGESQQMLLCYCSFNESPKVAKIKVHWPKNYKYISRSKVVLEHFKSLLMIIKLWFWKSWGLNHEESRNGNLTFFGDQGRLLLFLRVLEEFRGMILFMNLQKFNKRFQSS